MFTRWEKRGNNNTVTAAVMELSHMSEDELLSPVEISPSDIENMEIAAQYIKKAISDKRKITIVGDYDADGVCATASLYLLLTKLGAILKIRIPYRMSEGYGICESIIDEIDSGLIITVDNGISANEAISKAINKGLDVIVIDHHLPPEILPVATIIVDPHVNPSNNKYVDFCGTGLVLKLAEYILGDSDDELMQKLTALAATATVADVMPLTGNNRAIVKKGLVALNARQVTKGFANLILASKLTVIAEGDIGFKLAPIINAAGRLIDNGARLSCGCLAQDEKDIPDIAQKLIEINDERKALVATTYKEAVVEAEKVGLTPPIVIHLPTLHEGIVGIVAGKLAEKYKSPVFVFTGESDIIKGSGRTYGDIHIKNILDKHSSLLLGYGGHAGAAGLSIEKIKKNALRNALREELKTYTQENSDTLFYDICIDDEDVFTSYREQKQFMPFGEGNPAPIFKVEDVDLLKYQVIGEDRTHIKLYAKGYTLIGFGLAEQFSSLGFPESIDVVGKISMNESPYGSVLQVEIIDMKSSV